LSTTSRRRRLDGKQLRLRETVGVEGKGRDPKGGVDPGEIDTAAVDAAVHDAVIKVKN
jgi:hypothetical protein